MAPGFDGSKSGLLSEPGFAECPFLYDLMNASCLWTRILHAAGLYCKHVHDT